jgi:hypothetical protein
MVISMSELMEIQTTIDGQQLVFELQSPDPNISTTELSTLQNLLDLALETRGLLTLKRSGGESETITVDLEQLRDWVKNSSFDVSATDTLNDLLKDTGVKIAEFAITPSGSFTIALRVKLASPFETEDLSSEIQQIIQGPEVGLGLSRTI